MITKGRQKKNKYASPERLYGIDGEHSVKNMHDHPGKAYSGTTGAATIGLRIKPKSKDYFVDDYSYEESSDISNMSRYQLISWLRKLSDISNYDKGHAPQIVKGCVLTLLSSSDESESSQEASNSR